MGEFTGTSLSNCHHEANMPLPVIIALTADEAYVGLRPGVLSALRTGNFCLAGFLPSGLLDCRNRLPMELKTLSHQCSICLGISAVRDNITAHRLVSFLATWLTGTAWLHADLPHFTRPLPIMGASPRWPHESLL